MLVRPLLDPAPSSGYGWDSTPTTSLQNPSQDHCIIPISSLSVPLPSSSRFQGLARYRSDAHLLRRKLAFKHSGRLGPRKGGACLAVSRRGVVDRYTGAPSRPARKENNNGWESQTGRKAKKQHSLRISSVLEALESIPDVHVALQPWDGKLQAREGAVILSQQRDWEAAVALFYWLRSQENHVPNVFLYNIIFRILGKHQRWDLLNDLWIEMLSENVRPTNVTFSTLIDTYGKAGLKEEALSWFGRMSEEKIQPDEVTFNTVLNLYKRFGDYDEAESFFKQCTFGIDDSTGKKGDAGRNETADKPRSHNVDTYNTLIDLYGRAGRLSDASHVFEEMLSLGLHPDTVTFNTMIHTCGCHNRLEEAEALFKKMEGDGHTPDLGTYNILIALHVKSGNLEAANEIFLTLKKGQFLPDAVTYRTLLSAYCSRGSLTAAEGLIEEMEQAGFPLNEASLVHFIKMYVQAGEIVKASEAFERLKQSPRLSCKYCSAVIDAYAECELWREAERLFFSCRDLGLTKDTLMYNVMIKAYGLGKMYQKAFRLFEGMETEGISPDDGTFNTMIHMASIAGQLDRAVGLLSEMQQVGYKPKCSSFTAIFSGYGKLGKVEEAKSMFEMMVPAGVQPDEVAYGTLLNIFAEAGWLKETEHILDSMERACIPVNCIVYCSVMKLYGKLDMMEHVERVFSKMQNLSGGPPDIFAWNTLLDIYGRAGMIGAAHNCYQQMQEGGQADQVTCNIMMNLYKGMGKIQEALAVAHSMQELGFLSDILSFNSVIGLYATTEKQRDAVEIFQQMIKSEILPDFGTYHRLKDVLENPGLLREAVEQLEIAASKGESGDIHSLTALTSLYSLAKLPAQAMETCQKLKNTDLALDNIAYNAIINTFGSAGQFDEAVKIFMEMQLKGPRPNVVTFTSMILFYGKAGLVEGVTRLFKRMKQAECEPEEATYKAVIDVYREAGRLDLAAMITQEMQFARFLKQRSNFKYPEDAESEMN